MGMISRLRGPRTVSLYDRIGGHGGLEVIVEDFYCRVLEDGHLSSFYAGSDMRLLKDKQVAFLTAVLGGPDLYSGQTMTQAHQGRGITIHHFNLAAGHLKDSLCAAGIPPETIAEILSVVTSFAGEIASGHAKAAV